MRFRDGPLSVQNVTGSNNLHTSFTYLKVGFSQNVYEMTSNQVCDIQKAFSIKFKFLWAQLV